jgi:hypothetical protein
VFPCKPLRTFAYSSSSVRTQNWHQSFAGPSWASKDPHRRKRSNAESQNSRYSVSGSITGGRTTRTELAILHPRGSPSHAHR